MKNLEDGVLKWFPLSQMHLFQKSKKDDGEAKVEISFSKIIKTLEEDQSPSGETASAFIIIKWVI